MYLIGKRAIDISAQNGPGFATIMSEKGNESQPKMRRSRRCFHSWEEQ